MPATARSRNIRSFSDVRAFLASITIVVVLFMASIFYLRYQAVNSLLIATVKQEAESYANLIVVARHWNARYGGVYVVKRPGVDTNPFLKGLGVAPDLRTTDGRVLTLRNPAAMTREISELAFQENIVRFHMVSHRTLNPENNPDAFERDALERFDLGERDIWKIDRSVEPPLFRYMLPLLTERPCLGCHAKQGYREGDIRGGVSIMVPAGHLLARMRTNGLQSLADLAVTLTVLLGIMYFLAWNLASRLESARDRLHTLATTDDLTGLRNRRSFMEHLEREYERAKRTGAPLSLIMVDIDHFKKVNDNFGHAFGDLVLKAVAREMEGTLRSYDLLGRIGGEEFLIASPGSSLREAEGLAERIRERVKARIIADRVYEIHVTVSAGISVLSEQDTGPESLMRRSDEALYRAKQQGRDRVVTA